MTAIPKALAMANPKHVVAFVATAAGVISSKFAIDAVKDELDILDQELLDGNKFFEDGLTKEQIVHRYN